MVVATHLEQQGTEHPVRAKLKSIFSLERHALDLQNWTPDPVDFGIKLTLFIGPAGEDTSDAFDILLCTPKWFLSQDSDRKVIVANWVWFVSAYEYDAVADEVTARCATCVVSSWVDVAKQVDIRAAWKFRSRH
jgi:hypothetical protein